MLYTAYSENKSLASWSRGSDILTIHGGYAPIGPPLPLLPPLNQCKVTVHVFINLKIQVQCTSGTDIKTALDILLVKLCC